MKKIGSIIGLVLVLLIFWDFFFNNMVLLTKFGVWATNIIMKISQKFSEWYTDAFMKSIGQ
ncbi:hypothetical protein [Clostridium sp. UBA1353]|uniref:hypothetical protein n=1 Tax=Clostridium sp. UBA1353 TaxID=1946347 RepID=UPI003217A728